VKRRFRLTSSTDFQRVRRFGKSYAHPLVVLVALPNEAGLTRFGVVAGKALGNAVTRNQIKRRLRAALQPLTLLVCPGWDLIFIARRPVTDANFNQITSTTQVLLQRAGVLTDTYGKKKAQEKSPKE